MQVQTHWLGGLAAGLAVAAFVSLHPLALIGVSTLAGPLPDLDHPGSRYGRWLPLPGVMQAQGAVVPYRPGVPTAGRVGRWTPLGILWHRGPTHSLAAVLGWALAGALLGWFGWHQAAWALTLALGLGAGTFSHLVLDALNGMGEAWLWPLRSRRYGLPWPRLRVGSFGEGLVTAGLVLAVVALGHAWVGRRF
ncbi:MAG: metal-dependent hydrolase [Firmicutes bacterium]|nr:metal-dependent hydrolase [Bacillota bacterium]